VVFFSFTRVYLRRQTITGGRSMRLSITLGFAVAALAGVAFGQDNGSVPKPPPISDTETNAMIAKVKTTWRAQDGETAEQIIAAVAKVAHFVPRGWDVAQIADGSRNVVVFSWAKHPRDREDDQYTIGWEINSDGGVTLAADYAKVMELGWQAFALSIIQSEIDDDDSAPGANRQFLHDLLNFNFVQTAQGKLGDLLQNGRCKLGDPVGVDYMPKLSNDNPGDFFEVQLSVDCNIPGPRYFTHEGLIMFRKRGTGSWEPFSFLAHRIAAYPPGSWFDKPDPKEQEAFEAAKQALERAGIGKQ
jgi:hypothetical protein